MGDVGAVAKLLSEIFGFVVDPTGYEQLTRENKLKILMRGINDSVAKSDWARADVLFGEYRGLCAGSGP